MDEMLLDAQALAPATTRTPRLRRMQMIALVVMFVGGAIAFMDRTALSVATPLIRKDLGLSMTEMGVLLSALSWSYGLVQVPFGILIDWARPRLVLSVCLGFWSIVQTFFGFASNFQQFLIGRLLLGVGEGPQFPCSALATRDWFKVSERGFTTGVFNASSTLGPAMSVPLLSFLMLALGWRWMFCIIGLAGCVVAVLIYAIYRNPSQVDLTAAEKAYLNEGEAPSRPRARFSFHEWVQLFRFRTTWGMCVGWFGVLYGVWLYLGWLPVYLETERHMSIAHTGWVASIPLLCAGIGSLLAGRLMDWLVKRGVSPLNSRRYPLAACLVGAALLTVVVAEAPNDIVAVACVSVSMFLLLAGSACVYATPPIAIPAQHTGALAGIQNLAQLVGSSLPQFLTGYIVHETGSFHIALWLSASVTVVSAIVYFLMVRRPITEADLELAQAR